MRLNVIGLLAALLIPGVSWAGAVFTYHGRILDASERPVEAPNLTFTIRIYSPGSNKCLLFEEQRTVSMLGSDGIFAIPIGDPSGTRTSADPAIPMEDVFSNDPKKVISKVVYPKLHCHSGTTYTPAILDQRVLSVSFDDHSGAGVQLLPSMDINFVPFSVSAYSSHKIGDTAEENLLRVQGGTATPLTPAYFSELIQLITGNSSQYEKTGRLNGSALPSSFGNGQVLGWNGGWTALNLPSSSAETDPSVKSFAKTDLPACAANHFLRHDGSGSLECVALPVSGGGATGTVTSVAAGTGLINATNAGQPITDAGTLAVNVGTGANQIVQLNASSQLPAVDGSLLLNVKASAIEGNPAISASSITSSGNIVVTGNGNIQTTNGSITTKNFYLYDSSVPLPKSIGLKSPLALADSYVLTLPNELGTAGHVLTVKDSSGALEWKAPEVPSIPAAPFTEIGLSLPTSIFTNGANITANGNLSATLKTQVAGVLAAPIGGGVPSFRSLNMSDIQSNAGGAFFNTSVACDTAHTLTYSAPDDTMICEPISIVASQVTGLGALASLSAVDLGSTVATGTLAAARFPALTGDVTTVSGSLATSLANGSVTSAKIASGAVGTTQLADGSVSAAKLSAALGSSSIADSAITNAKLANGSVTTAKIASGAITNAEVATAAAIEWSKVSKAGAVPADVGAAPAAGSTNITTLGTVTAGTWNGDMIAVARGGTGTNNGSITGTAALSFTAGGANSNVNLVPTGTGSVNVSSKRITNLATPTSDTDAANKAYVDAAVATAGGGGKPKRILTYTSGSGEFLPLEANSWIRVTLVGGGSGGTGTCRANTGTQLGPVKGSAGGVNVFYFMAILPSYSYVVGTGGAGGIGSTALSGSSASTAGSNTTFGSMVAAGGAVVRCSETSSVGPVRARSNIIDYPPSGVYGAGSFLDESSGLYGQSGDTAVSSGVGGNASGYGAGGGGGRSSTNAGGNGSGGIIIIEEFGAY